MKWILLFESFNQASRKFYHLTSKDQLRSLFKGIRTDMAKKWEQGDGFYVTTDLRYCESVEGVGSRIGEAIVEIDAPLDSDNFDLDFEMNSNLEETVKQFLPQVKKKFMKTMRWNKFLIFFNQKPNIGFKLLKVRDVEVKCPESESTDWCYIPIDSSGNLELEHNIEGALVTRHMFHKFPSDIQEAIKRKIFESESPGALRYIGPVIKPTRYKVKNDGVWTDWKDSFYKFIKESNNSNTIELVDYLDPNKVVVDITTDELEQIKKLIPEIINALKKEPKPVGKYHSIGRIKYKMTDGRSGSSLVVVGRRIDDEASGWYDNNNKIDLHDNIIWIDTSLAKSFQDLSWSQIQKSLDEIGRRIHRFLTGSKNNGVQNLISVLIHELVHAKDEELNHKYKPETYSTNDDKIYYSSITELKSFSNSFFEHFENRIDDALEEIKSGKKGHGKSSRSYFKKVVSHCLSAFNFFSNNPQGIDEETYDFFEYNDPNFLQKLMRKLIPLIEPQLHNSLGWTSKAKTLENHFFFLSQIKKYSPKNWKIIQTNADKSWTKIVAKLGKFSDSFYQEPIEKFLK